MTANGIYQNSGANKSAGVFTATALAVPEPGTMLLLGSLFSAVVGYRRRRI